MAPKKRNSIFKDALNRVRGRDRRPSAEDNDSTRLLSASSASASCSASEQKEASSAGGREENEQKNAVTTTEILSEEERRGGAPARKPSQDCSTTSPAGAIPKQQEQSPAPSSPGTILRPPSGCRSTSTAPRHRTFAPSSGTSPQPKERGSLSEPRSSFPQGGRASYDASSNGATPLLQTEEAAEARRPRSVSFSPQNAR